MPNENDPFLKRISKVPLRVGIAGGAGYTGGELIRILLNHPFAEIAFVLSNSNADKFLHQVHTDLLGDTDLKFLPEINFSIHSTDEDNGIDVLFLCVGHGDAKKFLTANDIPASIRIIDLSQDFRLKIQAEHSTASHTRPFVYGLPELNKTAILSAQNIANPGCFATAIQLGLLPLAKAGLLGDVYTTGITGSTGAGQGLSPTSHFSWRANNIQAYKTLTHQHLNEVHQSLNQLQNSFPPGPGHHGPAINFIPWRGDFTRGIFVSSQLHCELPDYALRDLFEEFYRDDGFTMISDQPISLKQVVNTNKCVLQIEKSGNRLVVHSAMDNLLKGASGQAVQNMNLMFGLAENEGLKLKGVAF